MESLYESGWRQGSLFHARLPLDTVVRNTAVVPRPTPLAPLLWLVLEHLAHVLHATISRPTSAPAIRRCGEHDYWIVVTQDCDLVSILADDSEPVIELRPVFRENPPNELGIRSRKLRLLPEVPYYLESESPRTTISAAALTIVAPTSAIENMLDEDQQVKLKTWLGKRYDRPAVPPECLSLTGAILKEIDRKSRRPLARDVRDVLAQFDRNDPKRCGLFAIIEDSANRQEIRVWLAEIAQSVPKDKGVVDQVEVLTSSETSLRLIETSYAIGASDVTWSTGRPIGAH